MVTNLTTILQEPYLETSSLLNSQGGWVICGVVVGFFLAEGSKLLEAFLDRRKLYRNLRDELEANLSLIDQKKAFFKDVINGLRKKHLMYPSSIPICSMVFDNHISQIATILPPKMRDNIHIIYGQLKRADEFSEKSSREIIESVHLGIIPEPFEYYASIFEEVLEKYDVTKNLIRSVLDNKPKDVFYRHPAK